jgi:hypothetical protein
MGLVQVPDYMVAEDIKRGRLVEGWKCSAGFAPADPDLGHLSESTSCVTAAESAR